MREYLKIRDNVDLKELEKFGFVDYNDAYEIQVLEDDCDLVIDKMNREIFYSNYMTADMMCQGRKMLTILFDLIQAGLVEKVVEDE